VALRFDFKARGLVIEEIGPPITEEQIGSSVPESFPGKDAFVEFYLLRNGLFIPGGAYFYRSRFREISPGDFDAISVDNFYFIPRFPGETHDMLASIHHARSHLWRWRPERRSFFESHLPFACDGSGNDYWIEISSGRVKFILLEGNGGEGEIVDVAPTFDDFASNLEQRRPRPR